METYEIILRCAVGVFLILVNAFFVAVEFALTRLRQLSEDELDGSDASKLAWKMTERLEFYLTGCQLGISLSSIVLGIVTEPGVTALLRPLFELFGVSGDTASTISVVVAVFFIQFAHKIWGEQTPTYLGVERPAMVASWFARPLWIWSKVMHPLILAGDSIAKWTLRLFGVEMTRSWTEETTIGEEVEAAPRAGSGGFRRHLVDVLSRAEVPRDRRDEIVAAYEIGDRDSTQIMIPRGEMVMLSAEASFADNLARMKSHPFNRFPLVGASEDELVGIVYLPAVVANFDELSAGSVSLCDVAAEPLIVEAKTPIARLIDIFQEARQELAFLRSEGRVVGLVTATDAFEAIIGNLEDPLD